MVDWSSGFSARYYISVVDRVTLRDLDRIEITGGSIKRENTELRESASLDCVGYSEETEQIIRIWLDAKQESGSSHIPLFTGLATSPGKNINGRLVTNNLECYSMLKIAQDMLLPRGWYAPKGISGGDLIKDLLSVIPVNIYISPDSPGLDSAIIAEDGESRLSMTDKILSSMTTDGLNWRLIINGYGDIFVQPYSLDPVATFGATNNDVLEPTLTVNYDWYECPNVYRAVLDNTYAIARDDDPNSFLSTVTRGREVWYEDSSVYLNENETLAEYADKMLKQAQQVAISLSYDRRFDPNVFVGDVVRLNYPAQRLSGDYMVTSQSIELGYNAKTSEEVTQL